MISLIKGSEKQSEEIPFRLAWSDQFHLYVALGDTVKSCFIRKRTPREMAPPSSSSQRALPTHVVEITNSFRLSEDWVCGIAPFEGDKLVVLTVPKGKAGQQPEVLVAKPKGGRAYEEMSTDYLSLRGYEKYRPRDYHLGEDSTATEGDWHKLTAD